jgi:hypothetical protein
MSLINSETYFALLAAGTPEPDARAAATVIATGETRMLSLTERLDSLRTHMTIIQWVLGIGFAAVVALNILQANWMWQVLQRLPVR